MRLIGSVTSPFVRFVRVALTELEIEFDFDVTGPFGKTSPQHERAIRAANPLMKVPALITGEHTIIDSRVILGWLLKHHGRAGDFGHDFPESMQRENQLSVIYGALEAGILRFILAGSHPEIDMDAGYMVRSAQRMRSSFDWLDAQAGFGDAFAPPEALLVCALEWMRKRQVYDWTVHAKLTAVHERFHERDSLVATRIPDTI